MSYDPKPPWRRDFETARDPYTARNALGLTAAASGGPFQPLDGDLTALAGLTGVNVIYYRSAPDTWSPVIIGGGLLFISGNLVGATFTSSVGGDVPASGGGTSNFLRADGNWAMPPGGGNVSNAGTPTNGQLAQWTSATTIQGINVAGNLAVSGGALVVVADPVFANSVTAQVAGGTLTKLAGNIVASGGVAAAVGLTLASKGLASFNFYHNTPGDGSLTGAAQAFSILPLAGATRYIAVQGSVAGDPQMSSQGGGNIALSASPPVGDNSTRVATTAFVRTASSGRDAFSANRGGVNTPGWVNNTWTKITPTTVDFDQNGKYSTSLFRWTPAAGLVHLTAAAHFFNLDANGTGYVAISKNGVALRGNASNAGGTSSAFPHVECIDLANGTDYYEIWGLVQSTIGGTLAGATLYTFFQGHQL